jgi:hypothetical protein
MKEPSEEVLGNSRKNNLKSQRGGYECATYKDPALDYRHCGAALDTNDIALAKADPYTFLSHERSELKTHWENPAFTARGGSHKTQRTQRTKKQRGGMLEYPFESQRHEFPLPPKVLGNVTSNINTDFVSNKDLYGCLEQRGGSNNTRQRGGDCGCASGPIMLGGSNKKRTTYKKKQVGRGYGYEMNIQNAITNRPEVLRYSTEGTGYTMQRGGSQSAGRLVGGSQSAGRLVGGSAASDNLMDYFLNFQTRCRGTEIY